MKNIALAFSGGGFRAACFSLGSLSYLNHIEYEGKALLKNVTFISSTSGGSITNLLYSSFIFQGKSFNECYQYLLFEMDGEKLIAKALSILRNSKEWKNRPSKSRNIINAFSLAYDELFSKPALGLHDASFGLFTNRKHQPHLEEICINSTEFTNGLPFRFQSQHPDPLCSRGNIGNKYIYFTPKGIDESNQLKLADILASSSCFPSGFEPMIFPNDYSHRELSDDQLRNAISYKANLFTLPVDKYESENEEETDLAELPVVKENKYNSADLMKDEEFAKKIHFGIMDGGVADNQAIEAFKLADDRRGDANRFDLFISCDVTSHFMDGYTLPLEKKKWYNKISLNTIIIFWAIGVLTLPVLLLTTDGAWKGWMYIVATISGILALPLVYWLYKKIKKLITGTITETSWSNLFKKYKTVFLGLRIGALKQMILSRAKSVFILANDIYLKQIRRMYYNALFKDENYRNHTIQNAIYDLSKAKFKAVDEVDDLPSEGIIETAEKARTMGTTLWFDKKHQADKIKEAIIATVQFTTCYNLLKYLNKQDSEELTPQLVQSKNNLLADWKRFKEDPFWMVTQQEKIQK